MYLGEVIKQFRKEKGLSQQEFADKCGLSKPYISQLENNRNPKTGEPMIPSPDTFVKVATAMGTTLEMILEKVDENQPIALKEVSEVSGPQYRVTEEGLFRATKVIEWLDNEQYDKLLNAFSSLDRRDREFVTALAERLAESVWEKVDEE